MAEPDDFDELLARTRKWEAARKQRLTEQKAFQQKLIDVSASGLLDGLLNKVTGSVEADLKELLP